ncbi:MAG: glycosyltransferase family 2 protein [Proteobacteria bacterium]|nr:glycosyltransferase family 2 protein [Pseudomonadota bacterium]
MLYSVIIAFLNEEDNVLDLFAILDSVMASLPGVTEYWFVDDGSTDATFKELSDLRRLYPDRVNVIKLSRNFGHHKALFAGMKHARGDISFLMDADLQDNPKDIPRLLEKINEGYDIVYAVRNNRTEPAVRRLFSYIFWKMLKVITGLDCPNNQAVLRGFSGKVRASVTQFRESRKFLAGLFAWVGFKHAIVHVVQAPRHKGQSKYSLPVMLSQGLTSILSFSSKPLHIITLLGLSISAISFSSALLLLFLKFTMDHVMPGWTSIILSIFFSTGIIVFCIGLVAEYLGRIYQESLGRPDYVIDELLSDKGYDNA